MTRGQAIAELAKYTKLAVIAGCDDQDTKGGFGSAIDSALREMGYTQDELATADVAAADVRAYLALCDYYALKLLKTYLAGDVDIAASAADGQVNKKRSQAYAMTDGLLKDAREEVVRLGYLESDFELFKLNADYLEPAAAEI